MSCAVRGIAYQAEFTYPLAKLYILLVIHIQCKPQSLNNFSLRLYGLNGPVWPEITHKIITVRSVLDVACSVIIIWGIVAYTVAEKLRQKQ